MDSFENINSAEQFVSTLLSDSFAAPLTAICVRPAEIMSFGKDSFVFQGTSGEQIFLKLLPVEDELLPFDWLLARFAHLFFKSPNKYGSLVVREPLAETQELEGIELKVYGKDKNSKELCSLSLAGDLDVVCSPNDSFDVFAHHPLEQHLIVPLKAITQLLIEPESIEVGSNLELKETTLELHCGKTKFYSEMRILEKELLIKLKEKSMEEENTDLKDKCFLELMLGSVELSLKDFLRLREGSEISLEASNELEIKLCMSGKAWGKGLMSVGNGKAELKITQIG